MPETVAEKVQDLVMACLFTLIAVVALVKCRRVIILEGAEVRVRMKSLQSPVFRDAPGYLRCFAEMSFAACFPVST